MRHLPADELHVRERERGLQHNEGAATDAGRPEANVCSTGPVNDCLPRLTERIEMSTSHQPPVRWRYRLGGLLTAALVSAAIAACGSSSSTSSSSTAKSGSATPSSSKAPFNILFISGLSGPLAVYGHNALEGIQAAAAVLNQSGGIDGHKVVVSSKDDASTPANAVTEEESALSSGTKPNVVINGVDGDEGLATTPALNAAHIIGMNITQDPTYIDPSKDPYEYTTNPSYPTETGEMAQNIAAHGVHKLAVIYVDDAAGSTEEGQLVSALKKLSISTVAQVAFGPTALDDTSEWLHAAASHPDGYALITQGQSPIVLKGRAAAGITAFTQCDTTCGANPLDKLDPPAALVNADTLNNPVAVTLPAKRTPGEKAFVAELQKLGFPNDLIVPSLEYDFVTMLAQAAKQAGSIDESTLNSALQHVSLSQPQSASGMAMAFTPTNHFAPSGSHPLAIFAPNDKFTGAVFHP